MSRKPLVRECPPTTWYFRQPRYLRYMSREITSIFIAAYCVLLVVGLRLGCVPGNIISGAHYAAWAVLSVAILFLAGVF